MPQVPERGEFLVLDGKVYNVLEVDRHGPDTSGECIDYSVYVELDSDGEESRYI